MSESVTQSKTKKSVAGGKVSAGQTVKGAHKMSIERVAITGKVSERAREMASRKIKGYKVVISTNKATAYYIGLIRKSFANENGDLVEVPPINTVVYKRFVTRTGLTPKEQQTLFHITSATLARRLSEKADFTKTESDHFFRVAEVFRSAEEIFGSDEKANRWMGQVSPVLGGRKPKELLDSSAGVDAVKDELMRIAYGVYA